MTSVKKHYDQHLGRIYSWMAGGTESAMKRGRAEMSDLVPAPMGGGRAVDLGAGFGMHAIPLACQGFNVLAIDTCGTLLEELRTRKEELPVEVIEDDLRCFHRHLQSHVDLVSCMGDTLTHLPNEPSVSELIRAVSDALGAGGHFVISLRDYSIPLTGEERFIPVRSDENRILTCFLEYTGSHVNVHDILHERDGSDWKMSVSAYPKLRLAPKKLKGLLEENHFAVECSEGTAGMVRFVARLT